MEARLNTLLESRAADSFVGRGLGDARWRALLDTFYTEVRKGVAHFEGWVATIRDAMAAHAVRTRAGVHTGECEIIGEDVTGIAVHVAARIAAAAGAGEVFASATVRDLVAGSGIRLSGRGLHQLKVSQGNSLSWPSTLWRRARGCAPPAA